MVTIENDYYKVVVNPFGSELWSIVEKASGREYLWQAQDADIWRRRAPILFPVCGLLKNNTAFIDGKEYHMPLHGFARDYEHKVVDLQKDSVTLRFSDSSETKKMYPFSFVLYVKYYLTEKILHCQYVVENHSHVSMPFSIGYHTGYRCPLADDSDAHDCVLMFEKAETLHSLVMEDGLFTGDTKPLLHEERSLDLFDPCFPGSCIVEGFHSRYIELYDKKAGKGLRVGIAGFPQLVFWINHESRPFVCIEPWYGIPDTTNTDGDFRRKKEILTLNAEGTFTCEQTIEINSHKEMLSQ
ncbi:MAG: Aldose 1-epimerase family protein [Oscillospiraceae bacterium]|jgi:galactose mutarotase-like enzyme